jgi:serine/threonine protein kinase
VARDLPIRVGRYILLRSLGSGGMSEVFLGVAPGPGGFRKIVAVKCMHPHLAREEDFLTMFLDEARLAARLSHANVVQTFELGGEEEPYFIAMEYVHGVTLGEVLTAGPLPLPVALTIATEAASALDYAHSVTDEEGRPLRLVHRDVNPRNILVSFAGEVKLADFGVARAADQIHTTKSGEFKGTLTYMSPEQLDGMPIDGRSDIYSLGITLYEAFTRTRLFARLPESDLFKPEVRKHLPPPSARFDELPSALDAIVLRALEPDPEDRYESCLQILVKLRKVATDLGITPGRENIADLLRHYFPHESAQPPLSDEDKHLLEAHETRENPSAAPRSDAASGRARRDTVDEGLLRAVAADLPLDDTIDEGHLHDTVDEGHLHDTIDEGHLHDTIDEGHLYDTIDEGPLHHTIDEGPRGASIYPATSSDGTITDLWAPSEKDPPTSIAKASPPVRRSTRPLLVVSVLMLFGALGALAAYLLLVPSGSPNAPGPAPAKQPPEATTVKIEITSEPGGALVMADGADGGKTPLTLTRPRDPSRELKLLFLLPGHLPVRRSISLGHDHRVNVALILERPAKGPRRGHAPKREEPPKGKIEGLK